MNLLVDANWLIKYERELRASRFGPARKLMKEVGPGRVFVNPIAYCEFLSKGETPQRRLIADGFLRLPALDFNQARAAASLRWQRAKHGKALSTPDAIMAAAAIRHRLRLVTADKDFSGVPGLDWSKYGH